MRKIYLAIILLLCAAGCSKETVDSRMDDTDQRARKLVADIRQDVVDSGIVGQWELNTNDYLTYVTILSDGTCDYEGKLGNVKIEGDIILLAFNGGACATYRILEVTDTLMRWGYGSNGNLMEKVFNKLLVPDLIQKRPLRFNHQLKERK